MKNVCVIGIWHLGAVNAAGFAEKGFNVVGLEFDPEKAASLQAGTPPLFEPGLEEAMKKHLASGALRFSSEAKDASSAEAVVIAYDSPVNERDEVDISPVVQAAEAVAPYLQPNTVLVITSQVPLGSSERIQARVRELNPNWKSGVVYTPENLKLGQAIPRFLQPDMLVLGATEPAAAEAAMELYTAFDTPKLPMDLRSAEMVKHALNSFLATSISFINEMANLADRLGADAVKVGQALKHDTRIGKKALMSPGLGFSGGTLARDVTQLRKFSQEYNYTPHMLNAIWAINEDTFDQMVLKLKSRLGDLSGKSIGILGLTYKPGTSTMRRSPAIKVMDRLLAAQAKVLGFDPKASEQEMKEYQGTLTRVGSAEELAQRSDALILVTEWPEFGQIDFQALSKLMKTPILVDTKNFLEPEVVKAAGFDYQGFGRGKV